MSLFFLALAALLAGLLFLNWFPNANPRAVIKSAKGMAILIVLGVLALVLLTKNFHFVWGVFLAAIPWIQRIRILRNLWKSMKGPSPGKESKVSSRFFDMVLNHDSGAMDGRIKEGQFQGALLSELSQPECVSLHAFIQRDGDLQSLKLLESFLDRAFGMDWRSQENTHDESEHRAKAHTPPPSEMTEATALQLLGLKRGAGEEEIRAAHRTRMKEVHPDMGGSAEHAAQVNAAKDFLLNKS